MKERWHGESDGDNSVALTVLWHPQKAGSAVFEGSQIKRCVYVCDCLRVRQSVRCTYRGNYVCIIVRMCRDVEN